VGRTSPCARGARKETGADILTVSAGDKHTGTFVGICLPAGLLMQPDPRFALTLRAGYSAVVAIPSGPGTTVVDHFIPIGIEAVFSGLPRLDIGASLIFEDLSRNRAAAPPACPVISTGGPPSSGSASTALRKASVAAL
jgi:hypothetical protein